ncbi:MAG: aminotransferase class I/II-fold pyridoxal phosphate-dependent enzyme [Deltaproteobacteria bacterium]|nr:aminotransferase class I/II-fold pyridoxal phosphate-dependent enzyme [Deltaproteobacteria bacterium]
MSHDKYTGIETLAIHAGQSPDPIFGSVAPPIYQTSTFAFETPEQGARRFKGQEDGFIYTRIGNPTIKMLEDNVAALEGGGSGVATGSGMAAISVAFLSELASGDHVVMSDTVYGPSRLLLEHELKRFGVESTFVNSADLDKVRAAFRRNTKMVHIETPTNPTLQITDVRAVAELAHQHGALLMVDNTFASPILQRPLDLGADIAMHSMTKYINGHGDVVAGMLVARDPALFKRLLATRVKWGFNMDPHQAWLVLRGVKTLHLRVRAAQENAKVMAALIEGHPAVEKAIYPGLTSHPQYALAQEQMKGPGSMITFYLKGGLAAGVKLMNTVEIPALAVSLGGVESLIEHPASMTHAGLSDAELEETGITAGLVRLAVGVETLDDLLADMKNALDSLL